jgi:hypothetical protein
MIPMMVSQPFRSTDGTYTQMKTSGTLRYFNQSLVNIVNAYDVQLKKTEYRDEVFSEIRTNKPVTHEMYIKIDNKDKTDKFINLVAMIKVFGFRTLQEYEEQLKVADKLIEALKKEYELENG